ncbi:MAG: AI-2E family transporter [Alphaproteobacteria bacterium]|nr:AI-2E family transporter [Alphaproteobacteria bacterium]
MEASRIYFWTQVAAMIALLLVLQLGLLPALLAGLLVYQLIHFGSLRLQRWGVLPVLGRLILLSVLIGIVVAAFTLTIIKFSNMMTAGPESIVALLQRMADVVGAARSYLPVSLQEMMPTNMQEWQKEAADWLTGNAKHISLVGKDVGYFLVHVIIGMVIGGMVAMSPGGQENRRPLAAAMRERVSFLGSAFKRIVFSQVRISALNTVLTGIFLAVILPALGHPLPLTKTMIAVTFVVGLLPIIGNLISNTVIVLIGLSVSPFAAIGSLIYLVVIHKLEYFFNARIIGGQIRSRAWEILIAMIVMEAAFGIAGLVAAPIYYAYIKDELTARKLI